jgi:dienelactone hydrolase
MMVVWRILGSISLLAMLAASGEPGRATSRGVVCLGKSYVYTLYSPDAKAVLPAMLVLHGAGGTGSDVADVWMPLAQREGVVLIAPELPRELAFEEIAPKVLRCIVDDARTRARIDSTRVYVFGWSMGGYLTFDAAMFESDYFAGAAVYGAAIGEYYWPIMDYAERKIPIAMYTGEHDQYVPLAAARETRDSLVARGFPVHFVELAGQGHYLPAVADTVTRDAWAYLSAFKLSEP